MAPIYTKILPNSWHLGGCDIVAHFVTVVITAAQAIVIQRRITVAPRIRRITVASLSYLPSLLDKQVAG